MGAMSSVVPQERQLLPVETHKRRPAELHPRAPAICYDDVGRQSEDGQQHGVPLYEEPRVDLLVAVAECVGGGEGGRAEWGSERPQSLFGLSIRHEEPPPQKKHQSGRQGKDAAGTDGWEFEGQPTLIMFLTLVLSISCDMYHALRFWPLFFPHSRLSFRCFRVAAGHCILPFDGPRVSRFLFLVRSSPPAKYLLYHIIVYI